MSERSAKMLQGCPHAQVIRIPCEGCVEGRMANLVNESKRQQFSEDRGKYEETIASLKSSEGAIVALKASVERLVQEKSDLTKRVNSDWEEMKRMKATISDLAARLSAEAASRIVHRERFDEDEATA